MSNNMDEEIKDIEKDYLPEPVTPHLQLVTSKPDTKQVKTDGAKIPESLVQIIANTDYGF